MTGPERIELAALVADFHAHRDEMRSFRMAAQPALDFYDNIMDTAVFLKWGVGIGAGIITIAGGLRVLGIV